ncbi:MAG: hypothetical protein GY952_11175 [Rhodobacteraceae bacterium]|nr:hypothetical protein [Paracoccaceae bacterium]
MKTRQPGPIIYCSAVVALVTIFCASAPDAGPFSGVEKSTLVWGSFLAPNSVRSGDSQNAKFEVYAKTSFPLLTINEKTSVQAYSLFALVRDSQKLDFNSKIKAAIGLELRHQLSKAVRLSFGAKLDNEHRIYSSTTYSAPVATADLSVYKSWKPAWLSHLSEGKARLVLSGWSNIRYPAALEPAEHDNVLLQGAFKAAIVFPMTGTKLKLAPFLSASFKKDGKGRAWNNYVEPALGLDLKIPIGERGELVMGAKTLQQYRFGTGETQSGAIGYVSWYKHF